MLSIPRRSNIDVEGGKIIPIPAFPAQIRVALSTDQPDFIIQGMVMEPIAAAFPEPEPETIPNNAEPIVDT